MLGSLKSILKDAKRWGNVAQNVAADVKVGTNGRKAKLQYSENQPPVLAARIQDLYGVDRALTICDGRITVLIQVLAPNHRPVQITKDLATFWKETYPNVKRELQRKYPKHEWR